MLLQEIQQGIHQQLLHLAALAYASNKPDSISRTQIEEACTALQDNNTQEALMDLDLAMKPIDDIIGILTSSTTTADR
jgi:hypothetical protein